MEKIHLTTLIEAPVERVFDLSRSVTLHKISVAHTKEEAVAGTTSGLINQDETVTWKAKHFFKMRFFTSKITRLQKPLMFIDEMIKGDFVSFKHEHHFKQINNGTIMIDLVEFETPYKIAGRMLNKIYLKKYLRKLLVHRNKIIKEYAESTKWKVILN